MNNTFNELDNFTKISGEPPITLNEFLAVARDWAIGAVIIVLLAILVVMI